MGTGEHNLFDGQGDIESGSRSFSEKSTHPDVGWYSISPIPGSETESIQQQVFNILESITDAFIAIDRDWRFTYVNQEATRLLRKSRADLLGKQIGQEMFASFRGTLTDHELHRAIAEQIAVEFEDYSADLELWFKVHAYPSLNGISVYFRNITQAKQNEILRQQHEIRLQEHQHLLQQVTETVPGILYVYDLIEQRNVYVNGQIFDYLGYTPEQVQAMGVGLFLQLVHSDDLTKFPEHVQQFNSLQDGQVLENEYRLRKATGEWRWFSGREIVFSRTEAGLTSQILGTAYDITDRKQAERASQRYANQLRGLAQAALAMNTRRSVDDVLHAVTQQAYSIIGAHIAVTSLVAGQNWEQAIHAWYGSHKCPNWAGFHLPSADPELYASLCNQNQAVRLTQAELEAHPLYRHLSQEIEASPPLRGWMAAPLTGCNGDNLGLMQLSDKQDGEFTELDEDILIQLAQMASVAIENTRLYAAEQAARTQAEAANRIKDEFLAVLSHELRSPLNPILGWSKLLRSRKLDARTMAYALDTIERNAKLQTELIEDLLDVSRILQGKMSLNVASVQLIPIIEAAIETVHLAAETKNIQIQFTICDADQHCTSQPISTTVLSNRGNTSPTSNIQAPNSDSPNPKFQVLGDPNRLQQVVWNLLSNAVKFTPNGGRVEVTLSLVLHSLPTTNDQEQRTEYAQITVIDTGKGIAPDFLPHLFEYFRQEDGAITRQFGGLGLGLAIVRHIVELHGGSVQASSPGEGQGATFTVRLPLLKDVHTDGEPLEAATDQAAARPTEQSTPGRVKG